MRNLGPQRRLPARPTRPPAQARAASGIEGPAVSRSRAACPCGCCCPACQKRGGEGRPLDAGTRSHFESALGADLSQVRIHSGNDAARSAQALEARAYTVGSEIVFGAGQYRPESPEGRNLLGHELVHVLQQRHLALHSMPAIAPRHHRLEQNADAVARGTARVEAASEAMILRDPVGTTPPQFNPIAPGPGPGLTPPFGSTAGATQPSALLGGGLGYNLGGHTIAGDTQAVEHLLATQLAVGRLAEPVYFGQPMTLEQISQMLRAVTPILPDGTLFLMVQRAWARLTVNLRQLPALYSVPITLPLEPGPRRTPLDLTMPERPAAAEGAWQPSVGAQTVVNISRGGASTTTSPQRQVTLGDDIQVVFQDSTDSGSHAYSVAGGAQVLSPSLIESKVRQLQFFHQLLVGLAQIPGPFSATMIVQYSFGLQLTLKFGAITIQVSAGIQAQAQTGQQPQVAPVGSAMIGPATPASGTGTQSTPGGWYLGVTSPPPLDGHPVGGGMGVFGHTF